MAATAAMFCPLECHYPYRCEEAACGHLRAYGFSSQHIKLLEAAARREIAGGQSNSYELDSEGNVTVKPGSDEEPKSPRSVDRGPEAQNE